MPGDAWKACMENPAMPRFWNRLVDSLPRESKNLTWRVPLVALVTILSLLIFLPFRDTPYAIRIVQDTYDEKGRLDPEARVVLPFGSPSLHDAHVADWPAFAKKLTDGASGDAATPAARIMALLPDNAKALIGKAAAGTELDAKDKARVLRAFNREIIQNPEFSPQDGWESVEAGDEAATLLAIEAKARSEQQTARLNRLVVQAAFPKLIAESPVPSVTNPWVNLTTPFHYELERELASVNIDPKGFRRERTLLILSRGLNLGLDLRGGTELLYSVPPVKAPRKRPGTQPAKKTKQQKEEASGESVTAEEIKDIIQKRIDAYGLRETRIQAHGDASILVQLPGQEAAALETIKRIIRESGRLEFRLVASEKSEAHKTWKETGKAPPGFRVYPLRSLKEDTYEETKILVNDRVEMTGEHITSTRVITSGSGRTLGPTVGLSFDPVGEREFSNITGDNINERLAIILNSQRLEGELVRDGTCHSAPVIRSKIFGDAVIEGDFTIDEATALRSVLMAGSFPVTLRLEQENTVGPSLGPALISKGVTATVIAMIAVVAFMAIYYWLAGVIANFALLLNILIIVSVMILFDATLTMPGIAGLLLTVGMSVDANVLIFERIREEMATGGDKPLRLAIRDGYGRAFWTIFDANVTTLLTAIILYWRGTGPVKGFAVVLSIGILASMFTALVCTRVVFDILTWRHIITRLRMLQLIKHSKIAFMKLRNKMLLVSGVLVVGGLAAFIARGNGNWDIDFRGGTLLHLVFREQIDADEIVSRLRREGPEFADCEVQSIASSATGAGQTVGRRATEFELRVPFLSEVTVGPATITPAATDGSLPVEIRLHAPKKPDELTSALEAKKLFGYNIQPAGTPDAAGATDTFKLTAPILNPTEVEAELEDAFSPFKAGDQKSALAAFTPGKPTVNYRAEVTAEIDRHVPVDVIQATLNKGGGHWQVVPQAARESEQRYEELVIRSTLGNHEEVRGRIEEAFATQTLSAKVLEVFKDKLVAEDPIPRVAKVGPAVAFQMLIWAIVAIAAASVVIVAYVWLRFERFKYGIAAVAALLHDVVITIGLLAILGRKFNLPIVAALLTIIGYSINDTIVVFDRIRENLRRLRQRDADASTIDLSINQVLSRTVLTSVTTLLAVLSLFLFAGGVIQDFSLALLIGVFVGTYSSMFIASPLLILHQEQIEKRLGRRASSG